MIFFCYKYTGLVRHIDSIRFLNKKPLIEIILGNKNSMKILQQIHIDSVFKHTPVRIPRVILIIIFSEEFRIVSIQPYG